MENEQIDLWQQIETMNIGDLFENPIDDLPETILDEKPFKSFENNIEQRLAQGLNHQAEQRKPKHPLRVIFPRALISAVTIFAAVTHNSGQYYSKSRLLLRPALVQPVPTSTH